MDQEIIREEYEELCEEINNLEQQVCEAESRLAQLQRECLHPNLGDGRDLDGFDVASNECPDCGAYIDP